MRTNFFREIPVRSAIHLRPSFDPVGLLILLWFRHSRSYGDFPKKISSHLVSLIKVEGLISQYIVTHFDIVKLRIVGLTLRTVGPFNGRNKPIFLSHVWKICPKVFAMHTWGRLYIINHYFTFIYLLNYTHTYIYI